MIELKRKKYFIVAFLAIVCLLIGGYFVFTNRENLTNNSGVVNKSKQEATKSQENIAEDKSEPSLEISENEESAKETQETKTESTKETNVTNTKSNEPTKESTKEITTDVPTKSKDTTEKEKSETKEEKKDNDTTQQSQKVTEKTPWEKLGLTEDEYYNQPSIKSQKVTHKTFDECVDAGNAAIGMDGNDDSPKEYFSFSCYDVISPSGRFLGEMLVLF